MKDGFESLGRIRFQGVALLLMAFVVGALAGAAGDRLLLSRGEIDRSFPPPRPRPGLLPGPLESLDLTPQQREQITTILERRRPQTDSILAVTLPQLRTITDSIREEIRGVLTPEQQERLDRDSPRLLGPPGIRRGPRPGIRGQRRPRSPPSDSPPSP